MTRTAVVTGSASGIGAAVAAALEQGGWRNGVERTRGPIDILACNRRIHEHGAVPQR
jgi:NAD(P)-dependent dehydrogenase (short-subunit alcohol dehydrogenase family)